MPQQVPLRPGDPRRLGRYRLGGRIEGIPSDDPVFIGLGPDGREVAISLLRGDWAHDAAARDRFAAEAAVAKRVPPFCAARVLDAGLEEDDAYLVSEYVPGPSLLDLVAADGVRDGEDLDAVAIAMATGLASVHQAGLVHGNFGPEYVVLAPDGPPRVIEYGITPPYGSATPSADMLAWAQTVVFAATGRPPSRLDDLDVLPEHIRRPVEQCLDADPAERPAARAVVLELLGDAELPGGLLAEASRRAARSFSRASYDPDIYPGPATGTRQAPSRHQPSRHHPVPGPEDYYRGHGSPSQSARGGTGARGSVPAEHGAVSARSAGPGRASHDGASRGGGRRTVWLIAAAVVIVVVVAGVVVHLATGTPGQAAPKLSASTSAAPKSRSSSPSASDSSGPPAPTDFVGSWSGTVTQQLPAETYSASLTLTAGSSSGSVRYFGTDIHPVCHGQLQVVHATTSVLTLDQRITHGGCSDGTVTLTTAGTGALAFRFSGSGPAATGTLTGS
jgi:eukaryotic-like serine/threonine-protein kinase